MPHKVQVQAATVAGLGESRVVEEVLFSEEQGTVSYRPGHTIIQQGILCIRQHGSAVYVGMVMVVCIP